MFTPLRYQATAADCYPTSVLNALAWLFERHELPAAVLQRIYACCLDGIERGVAAAYTSEHASLALVDWLRAFSTAAFAVDIEVLQGRDLHLRRRSRVLRWLQGGGVAVLDVYDTAATTHSILALAHDDAYVYAWDPYLRAGSSTYGAGGAALKSDGRAPNLKLARSWLDSARRRRYSFGPSWMRMGVLIRRKTARGRRAAAQRVSP